MKKKRDMKRNLFLQKSTFLCYYEKNDLLDKNCTILLSHDKEKKWNMYNLMFIDI